MMVGMSVGTILIDNKTLVNFFNDSLPHSLCVCAVSKCYVIHMRSFSLNFTQHVLLTLHTHLWCFVYFSCLAQLYLRFHKCLN